MASDDEKVTKLGAAQKGAQDSGESSASGARKSAGSDETTDTGGNDTGGSSASSSSTSGREQDTGQAGDSGLNSIEDESQTYEGVSSEDFQSFSNYVEGHLDGLTASSVVIVVALFVNAGILAVGTLMRSFERG